MKKTLLTIGAILLAIGLLWYFVLGPRLTARVYSGWEWNAQFIGTNNYAWDAVTDTFTSPDPININNRQLRASVDPQTGQLMVEDLYETLDPQSNQPTWRYVFTAPVDPQTGEHTSADYRGSYFLFPRNVQKTTYLLRYSSYPGVSMNFVQEESIEGLDTYMFSYRGSVDYGFAYAGSAEYPGIVLEAGQEIKCWDDQLEIVIWVEPVTGEWVKVKETCLSGDYVYEKATGKKVYGISRWAGEISGDTLIENVANIRAERSRVLWFGSYVPALLVLLGLIGLGFGLMPAARK